MGRADGSHWYYSYLPMGISGGATSTLIPLFAYALGGNLFNVGIIAAATSIASVPAFILWGGACDRRARRKPFLLIGFLGTGIALLAMAVSRTMSDFYLANLLAGFLGAASGPAGTVLLMETSKRADWPARLAIMSRMTATGWVAGLALGIVWLASGPGLVGGGFTSMRFLFAIGAGLAFAAGVVVQFATRESAVQLERKDLHVPDPHLRVERGRFLPMRIVHFPGLRTDSAGHHLSRPLRVYLVSVLLLFGGFTAFYSFFPIFLSQAYGLGSPEIFAIYIASQVTSIAVYPRVASWVSSRGSRPMQLYGTVGRSVLFGSFFLIGVVGLADVPRLALIVAFHAGVGACWAVINVASSTTVSRLAPEGGRARALGAFNAVQGFGSIFGPLLGGFVAAVFGYGPAFAASVALVLAGTAVLWATRISDA
jgi:MFS family permease